MSLSADYNAEQMDASLHHLLEQMYELAGDDVARRLQQVCQAWLNFPYQNNPMGEGHEGVYDRCPLYRSDVFDCVTFVVMTFAMALSTDLLQLRDWVKRLNYYGGEVDYLSRHHFMECDWNRSCEHMGLLKDITGLQKINGQSIVQHLSVTLDLPRWLQQHTVDRIRIDYFTEEQRAARLTLLQAQKDAVMPIHCDMPYLPLSDCLVTETEVSHWRDDLSAHWPPVLLVEFVNPGWKIAEKIGTDLAVSHCGWAFRQPGGDYVLYHASDLEKQVVVVDLLSYCVRRLHDNARQGIHLQALSVQSVPS